MSRPDHYRPGQFSWVDLMTPDAKAAKRFYGALLGWTSEDRPSDHGVYTMFELDGLYAAGMGEMNEEMKRGGVPPAWSSYVTVEDVDASCKRVEQLGGRVTMPRHDIPGAGSMAFVADPAGAVFALWQSQGHVGAGIVNDPGAFCWNELVTRDVDGARRFYGELFGWEFRAGLDGSGGYVELRLADRANGGILPWTQEMGDVPPHWGVYFSVPDCDAGVKQVRELGGRVHVEPRDLPVGRFAVAADPQGAVFSLIYLNAPE